MSIAGCHILAPEPPGDSKNRVEGLMRLVVDDNMESAPGNPRGGWRVEVEVADVEVEATEVVVEAAESK